MSRLTNRLRRHLTFANCASALALFVALSTGGAYAKATLIDGRTIKPKSIPATRIAPNSISASQIKNGSITLADVSKGAQTSLTSGGGVGGDPNTTTGGGCKAGGECSPVDVVPSGVGGACRALGNTSQIGKWEFYTDQNLWACQYKTDTGGAFLGNPAKAGQYSGAINA